MGRRPSRMKPSREAWISRDTLLGLSNEIRLFFAILFSPRYWGVFLLLAFQLIKKRSDPV